MDNVEEDDADYNSEEDEVRAAAVRSRHPNFGARLRPPTTCGLGGCRVSRRRRRRRSWRLASKSVSALPPTRFKSPQDYDPSKDPSKPEPEDRPADPAKPKRAPAKRKAASEPQGFVR